MTLNSQVNLEKKRTNLALSPSQASDYITDIQSSKQHDPMNMMMKLEPIIQ